VVFISERCEGRPIKSRMGVFPEILSVMDSGLKSTESRSKPWVGWRLTFGKFCNHGSMFVEQRGQGGNVINQQRFK